MKRIRINRSTIILLALAFSMNSGSCEMEDLDFYIDCEYCLDSIPVWDTIRVSVTIDEENPFVPLVFYKGDFEDGKIDWVDTAYDENNFWLEALVGAEYSVKATYKKGKDTIIAVDGDRIRVVDAEADCYNPCYFLRGGTLDVRLK